jgi:hypothetical protein
VVFFVSTVWPVDLNELVWADIGSACFIKMMEEEMKSKLSLLLALFCALVLVASPAFAARSNEIQSRHIREADGTTGQDTNTGDGVKTGHIQDGAVTDAKISGPISADKIEGVQKKYSNVITVAKSGGDFTNVYEALNSINDAAADNPYLIKIMPGVYDQIYILYMRNFVDIKGSGTAVTKLVMTGTYHTPALPDYSLISFGPGNTAEIGGFTIEMNAVGNTCSSGMKLNPIMVQNASPSIRHLAIRTNGANMSNGFTIFPGSNPSIDNIDLKITPLEDCGTGQAVFTRENSTTAISNSTFIGGGISLGYVPAAVSVSNTRIESSGTALAIGGYNNGEAVVTAIGSQFLSGNVAVSVKTNGVLQGANNQIGGVVENFGISNLYNSYDQNFAPLVLQ